MITALLRHSSLPLILKFIEVILAVIVLMLTFYAAGKHLGSDPTVRFKDLERIGTLPWGSTYRQHNFGIFVVVGYLFILLVLLFGLLVNEQPLVVLSAFNSLGAVFYFALALLQYYTWSDPDRKIEYRDLIGVSPEWREPFLPHVQAAIAFLLGLVLFVDSIIVMVAAFRTRTKKVVRFDSSSFCNSKQGDITSVSSIQNRIQVPCQV